ncbi:metallophosphoesterase family protein [Nocardioides sp. InS609-2]|uniref:metallophosphoesterase family protein n=1 Tax=Nocardioides sp. InS609-2 TaxID=2760705 RepID=UPI0020BF01A8|nr:metallophosphoesterase family protein [Nocardioides sp. InS609-2]
MSATQEDIVVISDLHGNARAFRAALSQARNVGFDRLVILGDLLTYGIDNAEIVELVAAEQERGAALVIGNHDQLYFDLQRGDTVYYDRLPAWLRESVDYTFAQLDRIAFNGLSWSTEVVTRDVVLAHANPFQFGDWTYLNDEADRRRAREVLISRGAVLGVFGHTHRALTEPLPSQGNAAIANTGSIGQPRGQDNRSTMLRIVVGTDAPHVSVETIDYSVDAHVQALGRAALSPETLRKLSSYFLRREPPE